MSGVAIVTAKQHCCGCCAGQGLGLKAQGAAVALDIAGNRQRAGLGHGTQANSGVAADYTPQPNTMVLLNNDALSPEDGMQFWQVLCAVRMAASCKEDALTPACQAT